MKILFISDSLRRGGKERQLTELIKQLVMHHHFVTLILFDPNIAYPDVQNLNINIRVLNKKNLNIFFNLFSILSFVKRTNPDLIHSWSKMATILAWPSAKIFRIPLIDSIRYAKKINLTKWLLSELVFYCSDCVIANSIAGLHTHSKEQDKKFRVIYNGYDFKRDENRVHPDVIKQKLSIRQHSVIGMVANFYPGKDYGTFILAAQQILLKNKDCAFLCIGDGPFRKYFENMISPELRPYFYFTGRRDDIESLVSAIDIGVLLSDTHILAEGISNSIMEIMAAGKPVIATSAGGTLELVIDGKSGFLVPAFDSQTVAARIQYLIQNKEERITMGIQGQEIIKSDFNIEMMTYNYIEIYTELNK